VESFSLNAKTVRIWLAQQEIRQGAFAEQIGLTPSYFSQLMQGAVPLSGGVLISIHDVTKIPLDELRIAGFIAPQQKSRRKRKRKGKATVRK